ncbi:MAG: hypothetical protein ACK52I_11875 [Pseudomonadota bacterium]
MTPTVATTVRGGNAAGHGLVVRAVLRRGAIGAGTCVADRRQPA